MITLFSHGKPLTSPTENEASSSKRSPFAKLRDKLSQRKQEPESRRQASVKCIEAARNEPMATNPQFNNVKTESSEAIDDTAPSQPAYPAEAPSIAKPEQNADEARKQEPADIKPYDPRVAHPTIADSKRKAWLNATKRIGEALIVEAMTLEAQGVQYAPSTQVVLTAARKTTSGRYTGTGKVRGIEAGNKSTRNAYAAAATALTNAGLVSCSWPPSDQPRIPLKLKTTAASIDKIAVFCGLPAPKQNLMICAPEQYTTAQHKMPQAKPGSPKASRNTTTRLLDDFAKSCANEKLAQWARDLLHGQKSAGTPNQKAQPEINIPEAALSRTLKFLAMHPFPVCPPTEKRVIAAKVFGKSKALDGKAEDLIARVLRESGAVQPDGKQTTAETLRHWGILESTPALALGGDISISTIGHTLDLAALKEHFCVESNFFAQPLRVNAHRVRNLVVVENKAAFRECVRSFGQDALFAYVNGAWNGPAVAALGAVRRLLAEAVHCEEKQLPTYLWFDMDGGGIARARHLLERLPGSQCILMSANDYDALYAQCGYELTDGQLINVYNELIPGKLSDNGLKSLAERISEHGRGIEQEAMLTGYAQRRFTELFAKGGMTKEKTQNKNKNEAVRNRKPQANNDAAKRCRARIIAACAASALCATSAATLGATLAVNQLKKRE